MLGSFLLALVVSASDPTFGWPQELEDFQRGLHAKSMGYLDVGQVQSLGADRSVDHPTLGRLDGFQEFRRVAAVVLGPDSSSPVRIGLEGAWEKGGWTPDLYLTTPPDPNLSRTAWSFGVAGEWVEQKLFAMAGLHHAGDASWTGAAGEDRVLDPETDFWEVLRWHRAGLVGAADRGGVALARLSLLSDPTVIRHGGAWLLPQVEGFVGWERADWNRWNRRDEWTGELRVPVLRDRINARVQTGSDGFRFAQVGSNIDPQGEVGLDVSWSDRGGRSVPGIRLRMPILTFSVNDPDDVDEFGIRGGLVWSMRLCMTWEDSQTWYAPGRRPAPGELSR
jgi:hypothetical protein